MEDLGIQETRRGTHPTTTTLSSINNACLEILHQSRQVFDFDKGRQSRARQNANRFYLDIGFGTALVLQFLVAVKDLSTNEFWNCYIRNKQRRLIMDNGKFSIEVKISPNGLVCFPPTDHNHNQLACYLGNVKCVLPVEEDEPIKYQIDIELYHNEGECKTLLDSVQYQVNTHERGHDVFDYQEGRNVTEVERPQPKNKMTGILESLAARKIILLFQNLGDNGLYQLFEEEKKKVLGWLEDLECTHRRGYYTDLELAIELEESILLFGQNKTEECKAAALMVIERAIETNSPNYWFLMAKAHYIISAVYRQAGNFEKATEHIDLSTELLERVVVCEETAVNRYNKAALLAEKAARNLLLLHEKEEAEFCFENALLHWRTQRENDTIRCPMRTQIRKINYHLQSSRKEFPDVCKTVSEEELAKAAKAIEHVERNLLPNCSKRSKVNFFIAKSDYYIRSALMKGRAYTAETKKRHFEMADSILQKAFEIAQELGLGSEIKGIHDRLRKISLQINEAVDDEAESEPHSARATALVRSVPVERDTCTIKDLLDQLDLEATEHEPPW